MLACRPFTCQAKSIIKLAVFGISHRIRIAATLEHRAGLQRTVIESRAMDRRDRNTRTIPPHVMESLMMVGLCRSCRDGASPAPIPSATHCVRSSVRRRRIYKPQAAQSTGPSAVSPASSWGCRRPVAPAHPIGSWSASASTTPIRLKLDHVWWQHCSSIGFGFQTSHRCHVATGDEMHTPGRYQA